MTGVVVPVQGTCTVGPRRNSVRGQELCESVKVEGPAVLGSLPSLISPVVSVDVKQH